MQISKTFLTVCAGALFLSYVCSAADRDSEAQAKAREVLRQKMQELQSGQPQTNLPAPAAPDSAAPKVTSTPAPPPTNPPAVQAFPDTAPATVQGNSSSNAAVREALRKKMLE